MRRNNGRVPCILPHYQRRGNAVFFLAEHTPRLLLSEPDIALFDALDGHVSIVDLARQFPLADHLLSEWSARQILCWIDPAEDSRSSTHIVVIEPHMDDAILSVGGSLFKRADRDRITIASMVKWSNFTYRDYRGWFEFDDVDRITALRLRESQLVARMLGGRHVSMEEYDAPLLPFVGSDGQLDRPGLRKHNAAGRDARHATWSACQALGVWSDDAEPLARQFQSLLETLRPTELWLPIGIQHFDHVRARRACLRMLARRTRWFQETDVSFYFDFPYHARFREQAHWLREAFATTGIPVDRHSENISTTWDKKIAAIAVYSSQLKIDEIATSVPVAEEFLKVQARPTGW